MYRFYTTIIGVAMAALFATASAQVPISATLADKAPLATGPRQRPCSPFALANASGTDISIPQPFSAPSRTAYVAEAKGVIIAANGWTDKANGRGLYEIPTYGIPSKLYPIGMQPKLSTNSGVAFFDGKIMTVSFVTFYGTRATYDIYDDTTFEKLGTGDLDETFKAYSIAYDPVTKQIYGFIDDWRNKAGTLVVLGEDDYKMTKLKSYYDIVFYTLAFDGHGQLYAMTQSGKLCKVNKTTGSYTVVGETGLSTTYQTSMAFSPDDNMLYFASSHDTGSAFYRIDPATAVAEKLYDFPNEEEIVGLYFPGNSHGAMTPSYPENLTVTCTGGSMFANVKFTATSTTVDGTALTGPLTFDIYLNGELLNSGTTEAGMEVSTSVGVQESGSYDVEVKLSNADGTGPAARATVYIGHDLPSPVSDVKLQYISGTVSLTWQPSTGLNGEYFNPAGLTYRVTRQPDGKVVADGGKATVFTEEYPEPTPGHKLYYQVEAYYNGNISEPANSNKILVGTYAPPFTEDFSDPGCIDDLTIIDANNDGKTWVYVPSSTNMYYTYHRDNDADDYLVLPAMHLEGGKGYFFTMEGSASSSSPEYVEMWVGTEPTVAGLTTKILEASELAWRIYGNTKYEGLFVAPEDGDYYFALRCVSPKDASFLYLDYLSVSESIALDAPAAVTDLAAIPDPMGDFKAVVSFKAPALNVGGTELTQLSGVDIYRGDELITTLTPAVGESVSYEDTGIQGGDNVYTVIPFNDGGRGISSKVTVYVGLETPAMPEAITVIKGSNDGQVHVSWPAITVDISGRPIPAEKLTYRVARWESDGLNLLPHTLTDTHTGLNWTDQACEAAAEQKFVQYSVQGINYAGIGKYAGSRQIAVGKPYALPFAESFANSAISHIFSVEYTGGGEWGLVNDETYVDVKSHDADNGFLIFSATSVDAWANISTGVIDLSAAQNPALTFYVYNIGDGYSDQLQLLIDQGVGLADFGSPYILGNIGTKGAWNKVSVDLSAYKGQKVQFGFRVTAKTHGVAAIDEIKLFENYNHNLAVTAIEAPASVNAKKNFTVSATVENRGVETADEFTVSLLCDGVEVGSDKRYSLQSEKSVTVDFEVSHDLFSCGVHSYKAAVEFAADQDSSDDVSAAIDVTVTSPEYPAPTDLCAAKVDGKVALSWVRPQTENLPPVSTTDDFEKYPSFATGSAGTWTFIDNDFKGVGNFAEMDLPGITAEQPASFFIFDGSDYNATLKGYSGNKYLAALYNADGSKNDDWAISPELNGEEQTITFVGRSYSSQYPESVEILASSTGRDIADFTSVIVFTDMPQAWVRYNATLPAGTRFFAIRFISENTFMVMIDDVTYIEKGAKQPEYDLLGYYLYRDGSKVGSTSGDALSWTDSEVSGGKHTYYATAIYAAQGESALSNAAEIDLDASGLKAAGVPSLKVATGKLNVTVEGADGMPLSLYGADGSLIFSTPVAGSVENISVSAPGVYLVGCNGAAVKVLVK